MDRICIQLPGEDREALQRMAAEEHVSVAELVRRSIRRALAERGAAEPARIDRARAGGRDHRQRSVRGDRPGGQARSGGGRRAGPRP